MVVVCGRKGAVVAFATNPPPPYPIAKLNSSEMSNTQDVEEVEIVAF
jgi:hypothetical protein